MALQQLNNLSKTASARLVMLAVLQSGERWRAAS
jgi:hypothetical protein